MVVPDLRPPLERVPPRILCDAEASGVRLPNVLHVVIVLGSHHHSSWDEVLESCILLKKSAVPDFAIVPKLFTRSFFVMPIPVSMICSTCSSVALSTERSEVYPHLRGGRRGWKTILEPPFPPSTPNRDLNLGIPVFDSLVYCESSTLDHQPPKLVKPLLEYSIGLTIGRVNPLEISYRNGSWKTDENDEAVFIDIEADQTDADDESEDIGVNTCGPWSRLPDLVVEQVFSYLTIRQRYYASLVCRSWSAAFNLQHVWATFMFDDSTLTRRKFNYYYGWQGLGVLYLKEVYPHLRGGSVENYFEKNKPRYAQPRFEPRIFPLSTV
ncbi:unnamed protein product [Timema podura]|uniref:F-box domain-containing protein n=1 Tax=Timema podura TaxID=61482 RepID=A0ABN7NL82_TIMPD|nr:unnamed protein product [Timema podura]